jgi:hypothetical protein
MNPWPTLDANACLHRDVRGYLSTGVMNNRAKDHPVGWRGWPKAMDRQPGVMVSGWKTEQGQSQLMEIVSGQ